MTYLDDPRLRLIHALLDGISKSSAAFEQYQATRRVYSKEDNLYMREAHFVMAVGLGEGKTMSEIAEALNVSRGAASQTAGRLEKKGYILRRRSQSNYRQIVAVLTEKGRRLYEEHLAYDSEHYAQMDVDFFSRYTDEQLRLLREYEEGVCAIFTKSMSEN